MRTKIAHLAFIYLFCGLWGTRGYAEDTLPLVLLPVEGESAFPALTSELEQILTQAGKPVQLSTLGLDELVLALGCSSANVGCLQKIGESINTSGLIIGQVQKVNEQEELTLRWFDVKTGGDSGQARRTLPADEGARKAALLEAVKDLFNIKDQPAPGSSYLGGRLTISASVSYVEVFINGQPRGALPLELRDIEPNSYRIEARREGYLTWRGEAKVEPNKSTRLEIEMVPSPRGAPAPSFMEAIHARTWIVASLGLGCLATGAGFGAYMVSQQNEMEDTRGVTFAEIDRLEELKQSGERNALTANILFGVGGGLLLTAAILSYLDYRRTRPLETETERPRQAKKGKPMVNVGLGSIHLRVSF